MIKKMFLTIILVLLAVVLGASHSEDFLLGDYSLYYDSEIMQYLSDAHFNTKRYETVSPHEISTISDMLTMYDSYEMDLRLKDKLWSPDSDEYGTYYPTYCNSFQFQAEFTDIDPGLPYTYEWFYRIECENIQNGPEFYQDYIYELALICSESLEGNGAIDTLLAVSNIKYRPPNNMEYHIPFVIQRHPTKITQYIIKYHMRWSDDNYAPADALCEIGLKICVIDTSAQDTINYEYEVPDFLLSSAEPFIYNSTELTLQNFIDNDALYNYADFIFTVDISDLEDYLESQELYLSIRGGRIRYFCPIVQYKDRGTLYIDYIEIEDDLHVALEPGGVMRQAIRDRVTDIEAVNSYDNLIAFESRDEPAPPAFDAYKIVEDEMDIAVENFKLFTAISAYFWKWNSVEDSYLNAKLFDIMADPEIICPDYYAYGNQKWLWNDPEQSSSFRLQLYLDRIVNYYRTIRENVINATGKPFFPIVQTWGRWDFVEEEWTNIMLPTDEQQKMLLFLPLCYGADGIYTFRMAADVDISGNREEEIDEDLNHGALGVIELEDETIRSTDKLIGCINKNGETWYRMDQYYAVEKANEEIEVLGPIVKNLDLLSTGTIGTQSAGLEFVPALPELESISVEGDLTYYDGYVECGEYEDSLDYHYFMLVNRRTNFVNPDSTDGLQYECFDVNSYFHPADSQTVTFYFSDLEPWREYAFTDMYEGDTLYTEHTIIAQVSETGELESSLPIEPGDGRLIEMSIHPPIPDTIDTQFTVPNNKHCILDYPVTVTENGTLVLNDGVTLHLDENCSFHIYGNIEIGENVTFTSPDSVQWDGLYLLKTPATITMDNVTFERGKVFCESRFLEINSSDFTNTNIEHYGYQLTVYESNFCGSGINCDWKSKSAPAHTEINISNCTFSDYYGYPVYFSGYNYYDLSGNTISNCNGGLNINESGHPKMCIISNNVIENHNGHGIHLYHSYADILGNNVIRENSYGIVGANYSLISIIGNETYPLQMVYDNIYEEIVIDHRSYPTEMYCNKIYDDDFDYGTSDQYLIRCAHFEGEERSLDAEKNNWGTESIYWNEWDGDDRFDPGTAFDYIPVWDPGTPRDNEKTEAEILYAEADSLIQEEEYENAKTTYRTIIALYTLTDYAIYSMRNLLPLETVSGQDYCSLKQYYLTDPNCNINDERTKLSQFLANYCAIKMEQYPEAISFFEAIISDPDTELDSVYAVIDAGYTYLLMGNGGKSGYIGKMAELKPKSEKEFRIMRDKLLTKLFGIIETEPEEPNIEYAFELKHNYPNPFNSSTTISFSLPLSTQKAELKIYNIKGQLVRKLDMDNKFGIGSIAWDGLDSYGKKVGSGIYFYKLTADKKEIVKKMVLMR